MPYKPPDLNAHCQIYKLLPAYYPLPTDYRNHGVVLSPRIKFLQFAYANLSQICFRWKTFNVPLQRYVKSTLFSNLGDRKCPFYVCKDRAGMLWLIILSQHRYTANATEPSRTALNRIVLVAKGDTI